MGITVVTQFAPDGTPERKLIWEDADDVSLEDGCLVVLRATGNGQVEMFERVAFVPAGSWLAAWRTADSPTHN